MKRWMIFAGALLVIAVIGGAGYYGYQVNMQDTTIIPEAPPTISVERGDVAFTVTGPGLAIDSGETTLQSQVAGQIEQLFVRPGDRVDAGQILAILGDQQSFAVAVTDTQVTVIEARAALEAQRSDLPVAEAQLALTDAQAAYDKASAERESKKYSRTSQETLDIARANYIMAGEEVSNAEARYDQVDHLPDDDPSRAELLSQLAAARQQYARSLGNMNWLLGKPDDKEIAAADAKLAVAKARLEAAQRDYDQLIKDGGPELALAKAQLSKAEAHLAEAEADLQNLEVKAPFAGVVTDVKVKSGDEIANGSPLMLLSNPKTLETQVTVVEEDLPLIQPGQAVKLFFDAVPEVEISGKISRIVPRRVDGDQAVYPVYIAIDQIPEGLVQGMTVDATITIQEKKSVPRLPRTVIRSAGAGKAQVELWTGSQIENRTIQVGLRGDSYVEVLSGLQEGDLVVAK